VRVLNPVVHDEAMLKTTAVGEMVRFVERNRRRGHTGPIRLFQIARCFRALEDAALPEESQQLLVAWSGPIAPLHPDASEKRDVDLYDALGELDATLDQWGIRATRAAGQARTWIRTGTCAGYVVDGVEVGVVGEVAPPVRRALDADGVVFVAEFDLSALLAARRDRSGFTAFSAYPPVRRDFSLVVPTATRWSEVVSIVRESLGPLLDGCDLFDVFEGEGLPPATRALGLRLSLRSASGTLKDKKVDAMLSKLLDGLRSTHQIRLRSEVEGQG
jgi:phenylalanyl-tRNA synthetase beta chain